MSKLTLQGLFDSVPQAAREKPPPQPPREPRPDRPRAHLQRLETPGQWKHALIIDLVDAAEELERCRVDFEAARASGNLGAHMLEVYRFRRMGMIYEEHLEICRAIGKAV